MPFNTSPKKISRIINKHSCMYVEYHETTFIENFHVPSLSFINA